jgi:ABC-type dipeptide/oligopeptide/nickel transport system permease component
MLPTLLGITFLVFMLVALSPGGIGAALRQAGGQAEATSRVLQEAYLDDRYGLKDPIVLQYLRWLGRVSPIKFGDREQRDPSGEIIRRPKDVKAPPLLGDWYARGIAAPPPTPLAPPDLGSTAEERASAYRRAANTYANDRAAFIAARTELEESIRAYIAAAGIRGALTRDGDLIESRLRAAAFDPSRPEAAPVTAAGDRAFAAFQVARQSREQLDAVYRAKPFPEVGFWLIPGSISLGPPDFGVSFSRGRPVLDLITSALPVTILINLLAFPIIYLIAIPTGMLAATRRGTWVDVGTGGLFVAMWSIPVVWAGVLAVGYLANDNYLGWFPSAGLHDPDADAMRFLPTWIDGRFEAGYLLDALWHLCLPVACLVYGGFAVLSKQTRAAMLDNFNADYVRTAKAKGLDGRAIIWRHVFRNSLLPIITIFATIFPAMLSGSIIVERIFSVPGMGTMIIDAINLRDREVLLANVLMVGTVNLLALLLADILYALADPRVTYE